MLYEVNRVHYNATLSLGEGEEGASRVNQTSMQNEHTHTHRNIHTYIQT